MATVAIASFLTTAYSANEQRKATQEAQSANEKRARIEERKARLQNAREARKAAAQSAQATAQVQANSEAQGFTSTGSTNTISAINQQTASNIGFQQKLTDLTGQQINYGIKAGAAEARGAKYGAIGALPGQFGIGFGDVLGNLDGFRAAGRNFFS